MSGEPKAVSQELLMSGLIKKVQQIISNTSSATENPDGADFVSWFAPGISLLPEDVSFLVDGMAVTDSGTDAARNVRNARSLSQILNMIPRQGELVDNNVASDRIFNTDGTNIWSAYDTTLRFSEVASGELTKEQQEKIDKYSSLLVTTTTETNMVTDEKYEVTIDGPVAEGYKKYQKPYMDAITAYELARMEATRAETVEAVQMWQVNEPKLKSDVDIAYGDWVTPNKGYKNDYEMMVAYIDQTTQRDLTLYKDKLQDNFESARRTDAETGSSFYFTGLSPASFLGDTDIGWTDFSYASESAHSYSKDEKTDFDASAKLLGFISIGPSASGTAVEQINQEDFTGTKIRFKLAQAPIARPWFDLTFLKSKNWRFSSQSPFQNLSNGPADLSGTDILPAIPVTAVMIKDVQMQFESKALFDKMKDLTLDTSLSIGFGPISFGGNTHTEKTENWTSADTSTQTLTIKGMQIIAFKCTSLPKLPDPLESIESWA